MYLDITCPYADETVRRAAKALRHLNEYFLVWENFNGSLPSDAKLVARFGSSDVGCYSNRYYYSPNERRFYFTSHYQRRDESHLVQAEVSETVKI